MAEPACVISSGIQVRGNISGSGDLMVEGHLEGHIVLPDAVSVQESGTVIADVQIRELTVHGKMNGSAEATEKISVSLGAVYVGDLRAPRILLEDGALFRGNIEMDVPLPDGV
jgi:cytoskeletal protein CcmA (bactofilin family)